MDDCCDTTPRVKNLGPPKEATSTSAPYDESQSDDVSLSARDPLGGLEFASAMALLYSQSCENLSNFTRSTGKAFYDAIVQFPSAMCCFPSTADSMVAQASMDQPVDQQAPSTPMMVKNLKPATPDTVASVSPMDTKVVPLQQLLEMAPSKESTDVSVQVAYPDDEITTPTVVRLSYAPTPSEESKEWSPKYVRSSSEPTPKPTLADLLHTFGPPLYDPSSLVRPLTKSEELAAFDVKRFPSALTLASPPGHHLFEI